MIEKTPETLLLRLRRPEERQAWTEFVRLYTPLLYYWARHQGLQDSDADDLVQDVFLTLVRKLPEFSYDRTGSFRNWLRTVLLNCLRTRLRHPPPVPLANPLLQELADPGEVFGEAEYRAYLVRRALELMQADFEPRTWKACWEYVARGRPPQEVAAELGMSVDGVYSAKARVLRRLRTLLEGLLE